MKSALDDVGLVEQSRATIPGAGTVNLIYLLCGHRSIQVKLALGKARRHEILYLGLG